MLFNGVGEEEIQQLMGILFPCLSSERGSSGGELWEATFPASFLSPPLLH